VASRGFRTKLTVRPPSFVDYARGDENAVKSSQPDDVTFTPWRRRIDEIPGIRA
jgi:hypothetical protein